MIKDNCKNGNKLFSFGIGNDCDKNLIKNCSKAGKGFDYYASD